MPSRHVLLAGATGLVGRELLQGLLDDPGVARVLVVGRRAPPQQHPKLQFLAVDFARMPPLPVRVHECYIALGTTIRVAGSQQAFRAVDLDAVVAVARAARAAGATRLGVVSALGADVHSRVFYSRTKGEAEQALAALGFAGLVVARPSMLAGDRPSLGQPARTGERAALLVSRLLGPLVPRGYRPIEAVRVARALLQAVPRARGRQVLDSGAMQAA